MTIKTPTSNRKNSIIISGFIVLICIVIYGVFVLPKQQYYQTHHVDIHGTYLLKPLPIGSFSIIDNHGNAFTVQQLQKKWSFVFFGFTHCEMVCPVTLGVLTKMRSLLENKIPEPDLPQVVFITVDPERDTTERLNQYLHRFNPTFIGARTTVANTRALEKQFHLPSGEKDLLNHSPQILLINPKAELQAYFSYPPTAENLEKDYLTIVSR